MLELEQNEFMAGFVHLGSGVGNVPDRPRPEVETLTLWRDA